MARTHRHVDVTVAADALRFALYRLDQLITADFQVGGDRDIRDRLSEALVTLGEPLPCECCGEPAGEGNALCPACAQSR